METNVFLAAPSVHGKQISASQGGLLSNGSVVSRETKLDM